MSIDIRAELDGLFTAKAEREELAKQKTSEINAKEAEFVKAFETLRENVIRPSFQEIEYMLAEKGIKTRITESEDKGSEPAKITIKFITGGAGAFDPRQTPEFSAICNKRSGHVDFYESTMTLNRGGHSGGAGQATIAETSKELLHGKILKILREVIR